MKKKHKTPEVKQAKSQSQKKAVRLQEKGKMG